MKRYTVQVQAQFDVDAATEEDACDRAVEMAMDMESAEWGTVILESGHVCKPTRKKRLGFTAKPDPEIEALVKKTKKRAAKR